MVVDVVEVLLVEVLLVEVLLVEVLLVELDVVVGTTGTICSLCEPIQLGPMTAA